MFNPNAILLPSGDHAGLETTSEPVVNCVRLEPSMFMVTKLLPPSRVTNASCVPSGDPNRTQSEHFPKEKTAIFLQQLIFPQSAKLARLSNKR